jgi:aminopeptidase-like protein
MARLWALNPADGRHSLLDMADRAAVTFATVRAATDAQVAAELLDPVSA